MAKRGPKEKVDRPVRWELAIPESIAIPTSLLLTDPLTGRPKKGARSNLVTQLLKEHLHKQRKPEST